VRVVATHPRQLTSTNQAYETRATGTLEPVVIWEKSFRGNALNDRGMFERRGLDHLRCIPRYRGLARCLLLVLLTASAPSHGRNKNVVQYGEGLIVNIPMPEPEVKQVVEEVVQNAIIRGTQEYNKDEYVSGAVAATSTPAFPAWKEGGKVFYKVKKHALDPRNFKDSGDLGTLAVRYVLQPQGEKNTVLRIDALFVEDFRHSVHQSNGSVEGSEYKNIQDRLQQVELLKKETAEALEAKQERLAKQNFGLGSDKEVLSTPRSVAKSPATTDGENATGQGLQPSAVQLPSTAYEQLGESLEQHVAELRSQVERLVKKPGAPLKSAPFHTANTLKSLEPGVEVLILIATPYWYGVETHDGQHGWIRRDQLEQRQ